MGSKFTVEVWRRIEWQDDRYGYTEFWRGASFFLAILNLIKAKREGYGCVTLHWRGEATNV